MLLCALTVCFFSGRIAIPRLASVEVREAGLALWDGEAARPAAEAGGGLEVILGVTTAGEPGPRSIRLSSVVSLNVWRGPSGKTEIKETPKESFGRGLVLPSQREREEKE